MRLGPILALGLMMGVSATSAPAQVRQMAAPPALPDPLAVPMLMGVAPAASLAPAASILQPVGLSPLPQGEEKHGDDLYQPSVGQSGKDVIWVPTPDSLVKAMLAAARVTSADYVVDLGSGDGRIPIAAARDHGARANGIDFNPDMVALARRNAERAGLRDKVSFQRADIFESDFSTATVVTLYLLPNLNLKLRPTLLDMKPGTRIVSHAFDMGDWQADEVIRTDEATGYLWIVPARVGGRWAFEIGNERFSTQLVQSFQQLSASGRPVSGGRLKGSAITLALANGRELTGTVTSPNAMSGPGWSASRIAGPTP
jgi:SAM-dependent methyltransferase